MKQLIIAVLLICTFLSAYAQQAPLKANTNLDSLSYQYLKVGDDFCLVIDAVKDGLIKADQPYDLQFKSNTLTINGKAMSQANCNKYLYKIKQLNSYRQLPDNDDNNFASISGNPWVYPGAPHKYVSSELSAQRRTKDHYNTVRLVDELLAANIIYSRNVVNIRSESDGIWVNNKKLTVKEERRFSKLINEVVNGNQNNGDLPLASNTNNNFVFTTLRGY